MKLHKNAERKFSDVIRLNPQTKPHGYNLGFREAASSPAKGEMGRGLGKAGGREEGRERDKKVYVLIIQLMQRKTNRAFRTQNSRYLSGLA